MKSTSSVNQPQYPHISQPRDFKQQQSPEQLINEISKSDPDHKEEFQNKVTKLKSIGWTNNSVVELLKRFLDLKQDSPDSITKLTKHLFNNVDKIINNKIQDKLVISIFKKFKPLNWEQKLNDHINISKNKPTQEAAEPLDIGNKRKAVADLCNDPDPDISKFARQIEIHKKIKLDSHFTEVQKVKPARKATHKKLLSKYYQPQKVAIKNQQIIKVRYKNSQSEAKPIALALTEALKNANKKIRINSNIESLPTIPSKDKDNTSIFNTTYEDVRKFFYKIENGGVLARDNNYLPDRFIGSEAKWLFAKEKGDELIKSLFIDRMIAATFARSSKKDQLNNKALDKLMECVDNLDNVQTKVIGNVQAKEIICKDIVEQKYKPEPKIIADTAQELFGCLTVQSSKNWFWGNSYSYTSYDANKIMAIVLSEVNKIRLDAIASIYNCALRDKAILTPERLKRVGVCLEDNDTQFRFAVLRLTMFIDSPEINVKTFEASLKQLESNNTDSEVLVQSISYINNQTKDQKRCKELFNESTILRISNLLGRNFDDKTKTYCCEIINNCLEYDFSKGLTSKGLKNCSDIFDKSNEVAIENSNELKTEALRSILLTAEKEKELPPQIIQSLVKNLNRFDDKSANFVVMTLGAICEKVKMGDVSEVSGKLLDDRVIVGEGSSITFEERSKHNINYYSISSITAKILVHSLKDSNNITAKSLDYLVSALDSNDKQTRILSAKSLSIAASSSVIDNPILIKLREYVEDRIPDVATYTAAAYTEGLAKLTQGKSSIAASHIEFLPVVYAFEDLRLDDENFTEQVNNNVLSVLLNEAGKQEFDEKVFRIFDHILFSDKTNNKEAINILERYTTNKYKIPRNTIVALENALGNHEVSTKTLNVLKNVVRNGQDVSSHVAKIFADKLILEEDAKEREEAFDLLNTLIPLHRTDDTLIDEDTDNKTGKYLKHLERDYPEVLDILKLESIGRTINGLTQKNQTSMVDEQIENKCDDLLNEEFQLLQTIIANGQKLPINTFNSLKEVIDYPKALSVLMDVSKNKQAIPDYLVSKLEKEFNPEQSQLGLIEIFASITKNNQNISSQLLVKLEKALDNEKISDQALSIFALQGQKGEELSSNVINRICNKFLITNNQIVKQELSSAVSSIIQKNSFDQYLIKKALTYGLIEENSNIVRDSVNGFKVLADRIGLDKENINALVEKASNINCDDSVRQSICLILDSCELDNNQATKLKLANLNYDSNDKLLNEISNLSKQSHLLEQNFEQIRFIIDRDPVLQHKAIDVLVKCLNKKDIPEELINSIATLMVSTNSNKTKTSCCKLIGQIAETGKKVSDTVISLLASEEDQKLAQHTLGLIAKNQEVSNQANLLLRIDRALPSISTKDLSKLLKDIYRELKNSLKLKDSYVQKLLLIQISKYENKDYSNIKEFADVFSQTLRQQPEYSSNKGIVAAIEQAILSKKINSNIINGYTKIIQAKSYQNLTGVIDSLAELLQADNNSERLNLAMLSCITSASAVAKIPERGLAVLENKLSINSVDENIRSLSFKGLRSAQEKGYKSKAFELWCDNVVANLELNINTQVERDLDLLDTLASLRYIDFNKIAKKPQVEWNRELLLSNLLARFKISVDEKFNFYKNWLDIEQSKQFQEEKSEKILKLLGCNSTKLSFSQLNDIVKFLPGMEFKTAHNILLNSTNQYTDLKQQWVEKLLNQRFINQQVNNDYLEKLAFNINKKFDRAVIDKLLHSITIIENPREFELLLDFAEANQVKTSDICVQDASVGKLTRSLEIKFLGNQIQRSVDRKLANTLSSLLDKKWTFEQLTTIFSNLKSSNIIEKAAKEKSLIQVLEILDQYKLSPTNYKNVLTALNKSSGEWLKEINTIAVDNNFQAIGKVKNTTELIDEIKNKNLHNKSLLELIDNNLSDLIAQVKSTKLKSIIDLNSVKNSNEISNFGISTKILEETTPVISEWARDDIAVWASIVKSSPGYFVNSTFTTEALAVIKRANFLETGFHMTDSQILSCLVALNVNQNQGRLLQVATGEGKSTIVSVLAIINALKGKKVDIITSSPVLAERDAKEKAKLYKMFGLNCSDNNDKSVYIKGAKNCYKKDIVYGEAAQFQFDALRDEYSQLSTLAGRKCEVAIVDEVDSMLIDDSSKIARLSSNIAGMDQLQPIYHFLWQRLISMQEKIIEVDGKMYLLYGKLGFEQDKMVLEYADDKEDIIQVPDLKNYIKSTEDISNIGQPIEGEIEVFLKKHLEDYIKELFEKNVIKVPSNFKEFIEKQTAKWVNNAVVALNYQENTHYIVHEGVIKPVDYNSTGIVQSSTNWSDGLHQFLQIKHNLKMTSETFTTNFLSNMGYFKRYGSNLFGLTGTLGSEKAKKVLSDVYKVDLISVPSLRQKQYLELPTVVAANEAQWLNEICSSATNEANKERGTLIICETIEHTEIIVEKLREEYRVGAIKLYTMNNMNQEREIEKVNSGEIIVATNLAGRGTDIKTDEIEKNGGMHVIVTFMPSNERVEEQAFGRTARQGKRGTGQMILNATNLIEYREINPQAVKGLRNNFESKILNEFQNKELKVIAIKDKLFNEFCSLLNEVRQDIREKRGVWKQVKDDIKGMVTNVMPSVLETNILSAIEEQWAMFLRKIDDGTISIEQADQKYKEFSVQIKKDYKDDNVIKNPYYHIAIANDLVINDSSINDKYDRAMKHFDRAIDLDKQYSAAAYAGKAWLLLKGKERFWTVNDQSTNYKQQAIIEFDKALSVLNDEMASLNAMQTILQQQHIDIKSDLSRQLIQKVNILGSYSSSLQNAISTIKKSQRLIDIVCQNTSQYETKDEDSIEIEDYNTKISNHYGIERNSEGKIDQKLGNYDEFELVFNDLTVRKDCGTIDQAIITINKVFSEENESSQGKLSKLTNIFVSSATLDSKKYKNISINLKQLNAERLQAMLNPNIEIKEATKEVAIAQLKDKSSFFHRHLLPESWSPDSCEINLSINLDNKEILNKNNLQARDALKIIEQQKDDNLRFNLTFINSNEVSKSLQEVLPNSKLNIEYIGLDCQNTQNKLQQIKSGACNLEISGNKEELLKAIAHPKVKTVQFFNSEDNISEILYSTEASQRIDQIKSNDLSIRIDNLDNSSSNEIIALCKNASFNINFIAVKPEASLKGLNEGQINVSFNNLGETEVTKLIPNIRKENIDFRLAFKHLKAKQVEGIIEKASLEQESIEISKVKTLSELFMDETKPDLELLEFSTRGIEYLLEINEKRFVPWRSVIAVGTLAAIQMAAGGVLIATGFGANVGMGLLTEGAADIFTAYRAYSTRQFTWSDYTKQKAVSLVISATSMGLQKLKDAGKGIKNIAVGVGEEVLEQAGTQVVTNGKTIGKTLVQSGKSLKSLAFKQIGVATGEATMREGLNKFADFSSHFVLEQFKPQISSSIQNKVNAKFCQSNLMSLVRKMHALDSINKSQNLKEKVEKIVAETINPEHNFWRKQWDSVGGPLCKGILSDSKYLGSPFSMGMRILGTLNGMNQITFIVDHVHDQLVKKFSQIDKETLSMPQLLHQHCKIDQKDAREIVEILKKEDIIQIEENHNTTSLDHALHNIGNATLKELNPLTFHYEYVNPLAFEDKKEFKAGINQLSEKWHNPVVSKYRYNKKPKTMINEADLHRHNQHKSKVIDFCTSLNKNIASVQIDDLSQIMKSVSDVITEQVIRITESQLISPWSSYGMGALTSAVSNSIQDKLIRNSDFGQQMLSEKEQELANLLTDPNSDQNKIDSLKKDIEGKQTYAGTINHEAKKYTIAYNQCENIYYAQQKYKDVNNKVVSKEVKNYSEAVKKDKPADIADMFTMATENGIDLKIVDDPNYQLTEEDKAKGTKVAIFIKGDKDIEGNAGMGHWMLKDEKENFISIDSKNNDCGYAVFAELTGKSVEQLRNETAQGIEANSENFTKAIEAQQWIQSHYPQEANTILFNGGFLPIIAAFVAGAAGGWLIEKGIEWRLDGLKVEAMNSAIHEELMYPRGGDKTNYGKICIIYRQNGFEKEEAMKFTSEHARKKGDIADADWWSNSNNAQYVQMPNPYNEIYQ